MEEKKIKGLPLSDDEINAVTGGAVSGEGEFEFEFDDASTPTSGQETVPDQYCPACGCTTPSIIASTSNGRTIYGCRKCLCLHDTTRVLKIKALNRGIKVW